MPLRYWTAGESHGKTMLAMLDGFPAGLKVDLAAIDLELRRRQGGYGRGGRQKLETDSVEILTGVWQSVTLGGPITLQVINQDYKLERLKELPRPRPGHGDLSGSIKYLSSIRGILERASARDTASRVAAGGLSQQLLDQFGIRCFGYVVQLGGIDIPTPTQPLESLLKARNHSEIYSLAPEKDAEIKALIDKAKSDGDTLGGVVEVRVEGLPFGLGTHAQWDRKLDTRLAAAAMSVQAIKGVEIGLGFRAAALPGSKVHDAINFDESEKESHTLGYARPTNNAGGLEAGMTNGQPLVLRAAMKPISTLQKPLDSIEMETKQPSRASYERSDICAVPAASVILEAVVALEIATAMIDKFGGDSVTEMIQRWKTFQEMARNR
ncbi:MAG: chorismate synthase [Pirellulaceae bacterium]|nr:chorismate synthase [Planctomycetaceae bacterium]MDG1806560.1 chorismate synthase [Pirellulaceae bacterium]MDG2105246.1 chorismate synthase [Pirellulaceae bacterium]